MNEEELAFNGSLSGEDQLDSSGHFPTPSPYLLAVGSSRGALVALAFNEAPNCSRLSAASQIPL